MEKRCLICNSPAAEFGRATVRNKYQAGYFRCNECGFIFVEDPHWLAEAYVEPINRSDTGYVWRNLWCRDKVCSLIEASRLNPGGEFLDYAGGFGLLVRLMRDSGYDFRWFDPYCRNLFSRGFEAATPLSGQYEAVTAFEVLEHLPNPFEEIKKIIAITQVFIFSTTLVPEPAPPLNDWWYYGLDHGQHVAFYTRESLQSLARQFGCELTTNGADLHVLSKKPVSFEYAPPKHLRWRFWNRKKSRRAPQRPSLMQSDHDTIVKQTIDEA